MGKKDDEFIGAVEAASILGVGRRQVLNMIADRILPAQHVANSYIIRRADLAKVPKDRKPGPKAGNAKKSK